MKVRDTLYGPVSDTYKDIAVNNLSEARSVVETLVRQHINNGDEVNYFTPLIVDLDADNGKCGGIFVTF